MRGIASSRQLERVWKSGADILVCRCRARYYKDRAIAKSRKADTPVRQGGEKASELLTRWNWRGPIRDCPRRFSLSPQRGEGRGEG
jgi:hypothetical protein